MLFEGGWSVTLDGKGRISVPAALHPALKQKSGGHLVITKHPDGCGMLFQREVWELYKPKMAALPPSARWWQRSILGFVHYLDMDSTNRVLVPTLVRESVGLTRDIIMMGVGNYIELWDKARYLQGEADGKSNAGDVPEAVEQARVQPLQ